MSDDIDGYDVQINLRQYTEEKAGFVSVAMGLQPALLIRPFVDDEEKACGINVEASRLELDEVAEMLAMILSVLTEEEPGE